MEDQGIIELYVKRKESAIKETEIKYGAYCTHIAYSLLNVMEDAQECVNDTYMAAWERIPPHIPECLRTFLGRMTRNISIERYRKLHAKKRYDGVESTLSELEECLPSDRTVEGEYDTKVLGSHISEWLMSIDERDRMMFVRRYWFGDKSNELAKKMGLSPSGASRKLARLRESLREFLTEKGETL